MGGSRPRCRHLRWPQVYSLIAGQLMQCNEVLWLDLHKHTDQIAHTLKPGISTFFFNAAPTCFHQGAARTAPPPRPRPPGTRAGSGQTRSHAPCPPPPPVAPAAGMGETGR